MKYFQFLIGLIMLIFSYILAIAYKYNKFYAIFLIGMLLILKGSYKLRKNKEFLNLNRFLIIYLAFIILGLFLDLLMGLYITPLWKYPAYSLIDYIRLYLIIYPLGGLVMLYSFSFIESLFIKRKKIPATKSCFYMPLLFILIGIIGTLISSFLIEQNNFFILLFVGFFSGGITSFLTYLTQKSNFISLFIGNPLKYIFIFLSSAYLQGVLHEYPNIFVYEWKYINWPIQEITFLGIPIIVLLVGWIYLALMPYIIYELIIALARKL